MGANDAWALQIKLAKEPMKFYTENEIEELAKIPLAELDTSKSGKEDIDTRLKWLGLFHRRKHQCEHYQRSYSSNLLVAGGFYIFIKKFPAVANPTAVVEQMGDS